MVRHCIAVMSWLVLWPLANAAEIEVKEVSGKKCFSITISGEIDRTTVVALQRALGSKECRARMQGEDPRNWPIVVSIGGPGGDVEAAMQIGRIFRASEAWVEVEHEEPCASACVIAFLGGVSRSVSPWGGMVGLHRPYAVRPTSTQAEAQSAFESLRTGLEKYFREMNLASRLLEIMNSVDPGSVKWLRADKDRPLMEELGLIGSDPVWSERNLSVRARMAGISKTEMVRREQRAHAECGSPPDQKPAGWFKCLEDIYNGER